ncbi:MAG: aminotransferase class I/II-fold pyridoxal phosphate-dependent enzyme [Clostridiales bacterium]|jgi:DNA-binding transcriptional MocR family regulator|nr:aminotransferase class I/II-fold pyridoxal phosphate-dependent enzyme [Clostridiales bacterium]
MTDEPTRIDSLAARREQARRRHEEMKALKLSLDMSRGKPSPEQLDLSAGLMDILSRNDYKSAAGIDCRNYGIVDGLPEMKEIFAQMLGVSPSEVIVGGNSSLSMLHDSISGYMQRGVKNGVPWSRQGKVKFICPSPGYDRHFYMCEYLDIELVPIGMSVSGPDMDAACRLAQSDAMVKGMWCVPVFSNPTGCIYSEETVKRLAALSPKADDFRLYWDNAYCVHNFSGSRPQIPNILRECEKAGNPDMPLIFTSLSKVSFPGAAIAAFAASQANCAQMRESLSARIIGPDKLNQLRHVRFFKDFDGILRHMEKMAELIRPKFEAALSILESNLGGKGVAAWQNPKGGYFISLDTLDGCAKRTVELCREAGVILTEAGATFPYKKDPRDRNIRIAPTYPALEQLKQAMEVFCVACEMAALEKIADDWIGFGAEKADA